MTPSPPPDDPDRPGPSRPPGPRHRRPDDDEHGVTTSDVPADRAVERFLEEMAAQPQASPLVSLGGLRGKVALITGASSGIGRAVALELARCGVHIGFCYHDAGDGRSHDYARAVARELRELEVRVFCRPCDVRDPDAVDRFVQEAEEELGGLHFLVNNAGIHRDRALWRMSDAEWGDVVDTNLTGMFYVLRAVAPTLRAQEYGKVVNVTSVHAIRSEFGLINYASSKAGIIGFTRSAAVELGPSNVNVNAVAPGYIRTTTLTDDVSTEILDRAREESALGRLGDPQDVANVILFLLSEGARHVTGVVVPVDGGYLL